MKSWTILRSVQTKVNQTQRGAHIPNLLLHSTFKESHLCSVFSYSLWLSTNMCQNTFILFYISCVFNVVERVTHKLNVINVSKIKTHQIYLGAFFWKTKIRRRCFLYRTDLSFFFLRATCAVLREYSIVGALTQWKLLLHIITHTTLFLNYTFECLLIVCSILKGGKHTERCKREFCTSVAVCVCAHIGNIWLHTYLYDGMHRTQQRTRLAWHRFWLQLLWTVGCRVSD